MRIGPYKLANNLILAPMAGITDRPFRQLCKKLDAGLAVSEMVSSNASLRHHKKTSQRLDFDGEPGPISVQILGADPKAMAEAARFNVDQGAQIIDINMGCPVKKVCRVAAGSALLRNEPLVRNIIESVVKSVEVPVTLKIRTGWDKQSRNGSTIARIAQEEGIQALTIHGRTRACGFSGEAEYDTIREIKQRTSIPIIANGDIDSARKARQVLDTTGADGVMIGRAARGRPWIFQEINSYLNHGEVLPPPSPDIVRGLMCDHLEGLYSFYGEYQGVRLARKHIAWYLRGFAGETQVRKQINSATTLAAQLALLGDVFDRQRTTQEGLAA
ncbi:MAG: tRNA dihydrouridine synthase DusB [Gammaproteobacteria bacterium]|nr:tRNA dihydrouridine synthase DusB [Gammaproteobacteria bacterium]